MIELTEKQRESIDEGSAVRVFENGREYVVMRPDVYDRLADGSDNDLWSAEEIDHLREESVEMLDRFGKDA